MSTIRDLFERSANAIVQASALAKEVSALRDSVATIKADFEKTVSDLKIEVEHVRSQNRWLDEQLASVRKARDEANNELVVARNALSSATSELNQSRTLVDDQQKTIDRLRDELSASRKERDDYASMSQAFSDDLDKANAKIASIKASLGIVEKPELIFQPSPSVVPANMPEATQSSPTPTTVTTLYPQAQPEPEPPHHDEPAQDMPWRKW